MVLCRFFQQGNCKFGNSCRFEHVSPQYGGTAYVSPLMRQNTQPPPNVTAPRNAIAIRPSTKDARDVHNVIVKDITESEKGAVWPLSCYNFWPVLSHSNVPGLEDLSPEEMRYSQTQSQATGSIDACNQQIQQMYQQARARFNSLKIPSPETLSLIESLTRGPAPASSQFSFARGSNVVQDSWPLATASTEQTPLFGNSSVSSSNQASKSIFGGSSNSSTPGFTSPQAIAFGGVPGGQQSVFVAPSQFGASSQKPIFGGNTPQMQPPAFSTNSSIFGGASQSTFGGSTQQTSIFGSTATQQTTSPFNGSNAQQTTSAFSSAPAQQTASPFGAAPLTGQSGGSIFGGSSSSTFSFALPKTFGGTASTAQGATASQFGATSNNTSNPFVSGAGQNNAQPTGSIFGGFASSQNMSNATLVVNVSATLYSSSAHLTEDERKEFEAETFTSGRIPFRPPPKELC